MSPARPPHRISRRGLVCAATTVLAAGLASVLLAAASSPAAAPPSARSAVRAGEQLTAADSRVLDQADQILVRACMARHGFRYWLVPAQAGPGFPGLVSSVGWARRHGFGGEPPSVQRAAVATRRYLASLSASRRQVYGIVLGGTGPAGPGVTAALPQGGVVGQNTGTCWSDAETVLYRDLPAWFRAQAVTGDLPDLWQPQVLADPAYRRAARRWARCMRDAGYRYPSPASAAAAFGPTAQVPPGAAEIRTAVAAATCGRGTGLERTVRRLSTRYARPLRARYRADVRTYLRLSLAALPRARAVVRAGH
jgi:hypothetical protein